MRLPVCRQELIFLHFSTHTAFKCVNTPTVCTQVVTLEHYFSSVFNEVSDNLLSISLLLRTYLMKAKQKTHLTYALKLINFNLILDLILCFFLDLYVHLRCLPASDWIVWLGLWPLGWTAGRRGRTGTGSPIAPAWQTCLARQPRTGLEKEN